MSNIPKSKSIGQIEGKNMVRNQLKNIKFSGLLRQFSFSNGSREGYSVSDLIYRMLIVLYMNKPLKCLWEEKNTLSSCLKGPKKDQYYRLIKNSKLNWRQLLIGIFFRLARTLQSLTSIDEQVLILDDTSNPKTGKKIELLSTQYDHSTHTYYRGFTQLHLGWSDGHNYLPVDFCIKVGSKILSSWKKAIDNRTCGGQRRKETIKSKLDQSLDMLTRAYQKGISVGYVLFDTWFAKPAFVLSVFNIGYHSVFNLPKNEKMWSLVYQGQKWTLKELYRMLRANKEFQKIQIGDIQQEVASIVVAHKNGLELKLVFCRTSHKKDWIVFGSTDLLQDTTHILETYAKRWGIETFFKSCKQLLQFGKEQSIDFDVQVAMTTIRLIAYSLASVINRNSLDERTLGALFEDIHNEFASLNLDREVLMTMFELLLETLQVNEHKVLALKAQLHILYEDFMANTIYYEERQVA